MSSHNSKALIQMPNLIDLVSIRPLSSSETKTLEPVISNESNDPFGERVKIIEIQELVVKGVLQKRSRSHYTIGDSNTSKNCGPVLQIIPKDSEVIVRQQITRYVSKQNLFDGKNIVEEEEIGIKTGAEDSDFILLIGSNGCVVVESGAFVTLDARDLINNPIFIIRPDGQFAQLTECKQIIRLSKGGHIVLLGVKLTIIITGAQGFQEYLCSRTEFSLSQTEKEMNIIEETNANKPKSEELQHLEKSKESKPEESLPLEKPQKQSHGLENFKKLLPNSTYQDLITLSSDNKFNEMISFTPNTYYFRGNFGENQFICKVYNKDLISDSHRKYLKGELSVVNDLINGKLKNGNVIKMIKVKEFVSNIFLFMENCETTLLQVIMKRGPQNESFAQKSIKQMLGAVNYLHSNGIAHRDIKLDNIYVCGGDENFVIKLSDFRCALNCIKNKKTILDRSYVGSPEYMAPETLEGVSHDPRISDIWCLGICLFLTLHDCFPFRSGHQIRSGPGRDRMLNRQLSRNYLIPPTINLSLDCVRMYRSLMTPNFLTRPNAKQALKHPWIREL
jgi:hypothetical protein